MTTIQSHVAMAAALTPRTSFSQVQGSGNDVSTMPQPTDPLVNMVNGADAGSAIAALVMMTEKEIRKTARQDRDLQYKAQESAQNDELKEMDKSANAKFIAGITEGGLKLGSAGCSFASSAKSFQSATKATEIDTLSARLTKEGSLPGADGTRLKTLTDEKPMLDRDARNWEISGKGLEAYGTIDSAVGTFISSQADRDAKAAGNKADTFKRLAEGRADDVHEADKSIDKAVEFLQQWLSGKAATAQAALHRA